ncbi:universal stress protein [Neorhizobium galegae]|uniref:universal stress protein n=1 Tax=Neorhizobium galegae TaxID=399 RepID=UPI0006210D38|nr:universal stress protein [Neorhizobium galegae]KAB1122100.1 universal stress protein [Neorhizobium galegae]MCQ1810548.1 universal stress protein [Neorhizobium galegae]CDZ62057.1 Universal stress protein UspA-like protein [Neorhizobium galegae bv. orientalis]
MPFTTVLCVTGSDAGDADLDAAVQFARSASAHLSVLLISIALPPPVGVQAESVSRAWQKEREADQRKLRARAAVVEDLLSGGTIAHDVTELYTDLLHVDNAVGEQARYADLVILGPHLITDPMLRNAVVDGALFHSGVPVLLVSDGAVPTIEPASVVLAWNNSTEAAQAVKKSLPLLKSARHVYVVTVDDQAVPPELSAYLMRSGVKFSVDVLNSGGRTVGAAINEFGDELAADLVVMGAYGHSRLRERILGGVTRSMIEKPERPVLLAK